MRLWRGEYGMAMGLVFGVWCGYSGYVIEPVVKEG